MSSAKFSYSEIARRYAIVVLDLVDDAAELKTFCEQLKALVDVFVDNQQARDVFYSPIISLKNKKAILEKFCKELKVSKLMTKFLLLVLQGDRIKLLSEIYKNVQNLYYQKINRKTVRLIISKEMKTKEYDTWKKKLEASLGYDVELDIEVDPTILGGMQIKIGSKLYDGSISGKLNKLSVKSKELLSSL